MLHCRKRELPAAAGETPYAARGEDVATTNRQSLPEWALRARDGWRYTGTDRPPWAAPVRAGQESVWDYPRPPIVVPDSRTVVVRLGPVVIARSSRALRVLETASPPTFYVPSDDVERRLLEPAPGISRCEWKGEASYWSVVLPDRVLGQAAWCYPDPFPGFEGIQGCFAFYPSRLECYVGGERVRPQPGLFYGGWVTSDVAGPFKGEAGSQRW